jgi:protein TonB
MAKFSAAVQANKKYPEYSIENEQEGVVNIKFDLTKDGSIKRIKMTKSSGYPRLDKAALKAIGKTTPFEPIPQAILDAYKKDKFNIKIPI